MKEMELSPAGSDSPGSFFVTLATAPSASVLWSACDGLALGTPASEVPFPFLA